MSGPTATFDATKANSPLAVDAKHTALLLMDYQNIILGLVAEAGGPAAVTKAVALRDWARAQGIQVYHCMIDFKSGAKPAAHMKMADRWPTFASYIEQSPDLANETAELAPKNNDDDAEQTVVRTAGWINVLHSHGLADKLKAKGITSLLLAGVSSSGCVLSTARGSTDAGFQATVVSDACADPVQDLHRLLMAHALPMTAHVATSEELFAAWKGQ